MPQEADKCQELAHSKSTDIIAVARERIAREILIRWQSSRLRSMDEAALAYADTAIEAFLSVLQESDELLPSEVVHAGIDAISSNAFHSISMQGMRRSFCAMISELSLLHKESGQ